MVTLNGRSAGCLKSGAAAAGSSISQTGQVMDLRSAVGFRGSSLWIPLSSPTSTMPTQGHQVSRQVAPLEGGVLLRLAAPHLLCSVTVPGAQRLPAPHPLCSVSVPEDLPTPPDACYLVNPSTHLLAISSLYLAVSLSACCQFVPFLVKTTCVCLLV